MEFCLDSCINQSRFIYKSTPLNHFGEHFINIFPWMNLFDDDSLEVMQLVVFRYGKNKLQLKYLLKKELK